jgi:hypothetical protein
MTSQVAEKTHFVGVTSVRARLERLAGGSATGAPRHARFLRAGLVVATDGCGVVPQSRKNDLASAAAIRPRINANEHESK